MCKLNNIAGDTVNKVEVYLINMGTNLCCKDRTSSFKLHTPPQTNGLNDKFLKLTHNLFCFRLSYFFKVCHRLQLV